MLVLSRRRDECIVIGGHIVITVVEIRNGKVRVGVDAPPDVSVHRQKVHKAIERERKEDEAVTHDGRTDMCDGAPSDGDV